MVGDDETGHVQAALDDAGEVAWPRGRLGGVVRRDGAAGRDPAEVGHVLDGGLEVVATHVVEVDVDTTSVERGPELSDQVAVAVVVGGVEAELVGQPGDLLGGAGRAGDVRGAEQLRHLSRQGPDGTGGAGDVHDLALGQPPDPGQPDVGGEPGHAEHREVRRRRDPARVDPSGLAGVEEGVLAPAGHVVDHVADRQRRVLAGHDLAHGAALHGRAERVGLDVGLGVVHPAAHVGVDRQHGVADQDLTRPRGGQLDLDEGEVVGNRSADRAAGQVDLAGAGAHGSRSCQGIHQVPRPGRPEVLRGAGSARGVQGQPWTPSANSTRPDSSTAASSTLSSSMVAASWSR